MVFYYDWLHVVRICCVGDRATKTNEAARATRYVTTIESGLD